MSATVTCASSAMVPLCNHSKATVVHEEGILRIRHPPPSGATRRRRQRAMGESKVEPPPLAHIIWNA
jgi:hypothetical protein